LRIYVYTPDVFGQAALERSLQQLVQGLQSRAHECKVLVLRPLDLQPIEHGRYGQSVIVCGEDTVEISRHADPIIQAILDLQYTLNKLPVPDVIITLTPMCTGVAKAVTNAMDVKPKIISRVSGAISKHDHYEQLIYADAHLAISSNIAEKIREMTPSAQVTTVYHPVQDVDVQPVPRPEAPTFIYIGRMFNLQKRIDVMLRALAALPNKYWKLKLIEDALPEPGSSDEIRMRDLAIKLGIADRIEWLGYRESPWDEVTEATMLILPSDWEAFCYVLIEALIRGIPVVSSDCPSGPRDIIQHGHNGWLFKPGDVLGLAGTISRVLSGSLPMPDAEVCRQSIARFDQEQVLDHIEQALQEFVHEPSRQIG